MDTFLRRLKYYGIGFAIGLVFVIVLFRQKGCSWTPGNRVKSAILERIVFIDSTDIAFLKNHRLSAKDLRNYIEQGTVSFMDSKRDGNEKLYHFSGKLGSEEGRICLIAYREKSVVVDIDFTHQNLQHYQRLQGKSIPFLYRKKNWFSGNLDALALEGMNMPNAPEKLTQWFMKTGAIDANLSTFDTGNPVTYLIIPEKNASKDSSYLIKSKWFQEKIELVEVEKTVSKPEGL